MKKEDLEAYSPSTNEILNGKYYRIVYLTLRVLEATEITVTWHSWHTVLLLECAYRNVEEGLDGVDYGRLSSVFIYLY